MRVTVTGEMERTFSIIQSNVIVVVVGGDGGSSSGRGGDAVVVVHFNSINC